MMEFLFPMVLNFTQIGKGSPFKVHGMFGADFTTSSATQNMYQAAIGLEYLPKSWFETFAEISGETKAKKTLSPELDPLWTTLGFAFNIRQFQIKFGADYLVSSGEASQIQMIKGAYYKTGLYPRLGAFLNITLTGLLISQDEDHDGIDNYTDKCPYLPEDFDGFQDKDGCPDYDNDNDGVPDSLDKCPNDPEDFDGFQDKDGCPDYDNDKDGIPDSLDKCPNQPEDYDGFQDKDGCPDYDNDNDGIPDSLDKCPSQTEDYDGFQDKDGCPDYDNDNDGIPDSLDKCPNQPEDFEGFEDEDGCPDSRIRRLKAGESYIMQDVKFANDGTLLESSYRDLNDLWYYLKINKEVKVEIRSHSDALGSRRENRRKTEAQAQLIRNYLTGKGIDESRLIPKGLGEDFPLASNETSNGRLLNNRVEIVRIP
jgi:outer membrane protein OmpA-like peptidoglycan-associated protein